MEISFKFIPKILMSKECIHFFGPLCIYTTTTGKKIRHHRTKHRPRPTAPHGTCTDSAITLPFHKKNRIAHVICLVLYHPQTRPPTLRKTRSFSPLPTLIISFYTISYLYSFSEKKLYPIWRWPQQQWPKHVVDVEKLYTPDNIFVLYPYGIITVGSSKHNEDDAPWSYRHVKCVKCSCRLNCAL